MSIRKYSYINEPELAKELPFSYFSCVPYLDYAADVLTLDGGERLLVSQDLLFPQSFPCLFLPKDKKLWHNLAVTFASEKDRAKVLNSGRELLIDKPLTSPEYYYKIWDLTNPKGKYGAKIKQFEALYDYRISSECSKEEVIILYNSWKKQKPREALTFNESEEFFYFCLESLEKYKIRQTYVRIKDKLVGFAWSCLHSSGKGVGLHLKCQYEYEGLGRFLYYQLALMLKDCEELTLGNAPEEGLDQFKKRLGPSRIEHYTYLLIGK